MLFSPLEQFDAVILFHINIFSFHHCPYCCPIIYDWINLYPTFYEGIWLWYRCCFCSGWGIDVTLFHIIVPLFLIKLIYYFLYLGEKSVSLVPQTFLQWLIEKLVLFIFNMLKQQLGSQSYIYFIMIFFIFYTILFLNLLSLLPFGIALTSHIVIMLVFSLSIYLGIFFIGIYYHNISFLKIFIPKCPVWLLPLLIIIEIFSYILRSFSLAIRLAANIMAGHTLVFIVSSFILKITELNIFFIFLGFFILILVLFLELGVAFLQAYVFTTLLLIYLNDSLVGGDQH